MRVGAWDVFQGARYRVRLDSEILGGRTAFGRDRHLSVTLALSRGAAEGGDSGLGFSLPLQSLGEACLSPQTHTPSPQLWVAAPQTVLSQS